MERMNFLRVLSKEEELESRKKSFAEIKRGSLFDLGGQRCFIAVEKESQRCKAIELTEENRERIITEQPCETLELHFDEMGCLNLKRE